MGKRATVGTCLASLVKMAVPLCQQAERECPRTGPGRKPEIADWTLAVLIMVAVVKRKKSKSAQYRFLDEHRRELVDLLGTGKFPARSTYFDRYRRAHRLFAAAVKLQGERAVAEGIVDATVVCAAAVERDIGRLDAAITGIQMAHHAEIQDRRFVSCQNSFRNVLDPHVT
jgi:hypothetical protein